MSNRERSAIVSALTGKGFSQKSVKRRSGHDFFYFQADGLKRAIGTKISRGSSYKIYDSGLLGKMCRQLCISKDELLELIDCPLDREDYIQALRTRGVIGD